MSSPTLTPDNRRVICPCNDLTESDILAAIRGGCSTIQELKDKTGVATKCTGCEAYLYDLFDVRPGVQAALRPRRRLPPLRQIARRAYRLLRPAWLKSAAFVIERPDLHTRINIANLQFPEHQRPAKAVAARVILHDENGAVRLERPCAIPGNGTLSIDVGDLVRDAGLPLPFIGFVMVRLRSEILGSLRFYCHWHNETSLTTTHEKYTDTPIQYGYVTLSKIICTPTYSTYLSLTNLADEPYRADLVVFREGAVLARTPVSLPRRGSAFIDLAPIVGDHLKGGEPGLYVENHRQPAMYYYFGHNKARGTWQVQHL